MESLVAELSAMRTELQSLKQHVQTESSRNMEEDWNEDEEEDSVVVPDSEGQPWGAVLGASTVEATKPASLSLASLLSAPPSGAARGGGESEKV